MRVKHKVLIKRIHFEGDEAAENSGQKSMNGGQKRLGKYIQPPWGGRGQQHFSDNPSYISIISYTAENCFLYQKIHISEGFFTLMKTHIYRTERSLVKNTKTLWQNVGGAEVSFSLVLFHCVCVCVRAFSCQKAEPTANLGPTPSRK